MGRLIALEVQGFIQGLVVAGVVVVVVVEVEVAAIVFGGVLFCFKDLRQWNHRRHRSSHSYILDPC